MCALCMHVYACMCIVCVCVHMHVHVFTCAHDPICMRICIALSVHACMCTHCVHVWVPLSQASQRISGDTQSRAWSGVFPCQLQSLVKNENTMKREGPFALLHTLCPPSSPRVTPFLKWHDPTRPQLYPFPQTKGSTRTVHRCLAPPLSLVASYSSCSQHPAPLPPPYGSENFPTGTAVSRQTAGCDPMV